MKILLISDAHSNSVALKAVLDNEKEWDAIYFAGDYVNYGTDPKGVIEWMKKYNVIGVKGNHDNDIVDIWPVEDHDKMGDSDFKWIHHNALLLSESDIEFLRSKPRVLSFDIDGIAYVMMHQWEHGTIQNKHHFETIWKENYRGDLRGKYEKRIIFGHTHRQEAHPLDKDMIWLNPGSVSYRHPDDIMKNAHYITITDGLIKLKEVPYEKKQILNNVLTWEGRVEQSEIEKVKRLLSE